MKECRKRVHDVGVSGVRVALREGPLNALALLPSRRVAADRPTTFPSDLRRTEAS